MTIASTEEPPSIPGVPESVDFANPSALAAFGELTRRITVDVNIPEERWLERLPWLETLAVEAARDACLAGGASVIPAEAMAEMSLTFADDNYMQELNARYRGIESPTNVLSFPAASVADFPVNPADFSVSPAEGPRPELLLGDLVLGFETVVKEAENQGKRLGDHVAHLVIHGVLHLLGFDHVQDDQAARMERLETSIMENLGIDDPYCPSDGKTR
ncbi:MAG: rRNA maturation RNase YbeY [Proteobacteria bacterium]|nr:rRNA maturation RNase YbeY [Pseudomonadota bacterium]